MSTGNFHNVNSSFTYACELEDEFDYECLVDNLKCALSNIESDYEVSGNDSHELRSYPSRVIAAFGMFKNYQEFSVSAEISIIIRSGYYSGCKLDWAVVYSVAGEETDTLDFADLIEYYADCSRKMSAHKAKLAEHWAETTSQKMINKVENIFKCQMAQMVL